jgi:hypothetical protein
VDETLLGCLATFLPLDDINQWGEASSPQLVIDVVIDVVINGVI